MMILDVEIIAKLAYDGGVGGGPFMMRGIFS